MSNLRLPKLIAIVGPTASGKTALSLPLAKKFHGEIISVDSRQVYRGMDIGTAKPAKSEQKRVPHHLVDVKKPTQRYTVQQFKTDASKLIHKITKKGNIPFLVGGTGLYLYTLINNWDIPQAKPNQKLRQRLARLGLKRAWKKLLYLDPAAGSFVDPKNPRRVFRALEVILATGRPLSQQYGAKKPLFDVLILGIDITKALLRQNIGRRVDQMFRRGLVAETKKIIKHYGRRKILSETIGYREIINCLDKKITLAEAREQVKKNTWHYTKHQYNWFRRLPVVWVKTSTQAKKQIKNFLKKTKKDSF